MQVFSSSGPKIPWKSISKNCPKSRKQGGAWASLRLPPLRPRVQQCQELLQGLITRSHRECGSLSCLFQKKFQEFPAGTLLACRGSRGRNESEGDVISLSCPSSLCLAPPAECCGCLYSSLANTGWHFPHVALGISLWRPSWPCRRWRLQFLLLHRF